MASVAGPLLAVVGRTVEGLGYELVDLEREGRGLLRVTIDRVGNTGAAAAAPLVTVDDCEKVSHQLTHLLAAENVDYERLEVSSPGVDRPLKKARDYERFAGAEVQVQLMAPLNGRKRWRGTIAAVSGAAGAERIRLRPTPEDEAREPVRRVSPVPKKVNRKAGAQSQPPADVEFALADVDRARLVPVLDFRSKR
ncbi:MAG: ribosome maturation factor RimP [Burkholderiales bacterium]|nr:ribosome maturation factor RimP [Burkholderiales bacterium]